MTDEILNAIQAACQSWPALSAVKTYHKFSGMLPGTQFTISIACGTIRFRQQDNDTDEATLPVEVLVYIKNQINPVKAEQAILALAEEVRFALLEDDTLGGAVGHFDVSEIVPATNEVDKTEMLHYAVVCGEATFFAPRSSSDEAQPILEEIDLLINRESISISEEG